MPTLNRDEHFNDLLEEAITKATYVDEVGNEKEIEVACDAIRAEYAALRTKLDKAMEGLRVYANKENWSVDPEYPTIPEWVGELDDPCESAARILAELEQE